jgi:stage III sporulation protein AE
LKIYGRKILKTIYMLLLSITFVLSVLLTVTLPAHAQEEPDEVRIIDEGLQSSEIKSLSEQLQKYTTGGSEEIIEGYDPSTLIKDLGKGSFNLNMKGVLAKAGGFLFKEIYLNLHIMIKLVVLAILCAVLKQLRSSFLSESVGELAFFACYIVLVSILVVGFHQAASLGVNVIENIVAFMYSTLPVLITLLVSGGNIVSGTVFQPVLIMAAEVSAGILKNVFIPLIFFSAVLSILNNITDRFNISKLAELLKKVTTWGLGLMLTVFVAFVTIQGSIGAVTDGVSGKSLKFTLGLLPVVGGYLADAADTVLGCALLIKNAAGFGIMIGIIVICLVPIMKILSLIALYRITCAVIEPVSEERVIKCINEVAGTLTYILAVVTSVVFMFLISVTAIIGASNISTMIR